MSAVHITYCRHLHCFSTGCQLCTIHTFVTYIALVQDVSCAQYILSSFSLLYYRMSVVHNTYCRHFHCFSTGCQLCTIHTLVIFIALVQGVSLCIIHTVVTYIALVQDVSCAHYILWVVTYMHRMSAVHNTYCRHLHCFSTGCQLCIITYCRHLHCFSTGCQLCTIHTVVTYIALVQDVSCAQYILSSLTLLQYRMSAVHNTYCRHFHCFSTGCQLCTIHTVVTYIALVQDVSCAQYILSSLTLLQYRMSAMHNTYCRHLHCFSTGCQLCTIHTVVIFIALLQDVSCTQYILSSFSLLQYRMSAVHNTYSRHFHCFSTGCQLCIIHTVVTYIALVQDVSCVHITYCRHLHCFSTGCQLCTIHTVVTLHCFSTGCQLCTIHTVVIFIALHRMSVTQYILLYRISAVHNTYCRHFHCFSTGCQLCTLHTAFLLQYRVSVMHNTYCRHLHSFSTGCQLCTLHTVVTYIALVQDVSCAHYILSSLTLLQYRMSAMHNTYCRHLHCFSTGCQLCTIHTVVTYIALVQDVSCAQYILSSLTLLQYRMSAVHNTYCRHFHCFIQDVSCAQYILRHFIALVQGVSCA